MREVTFAATLNQLCIQRYGRNRAELAQAIGVSESALAQYTSGTTTPRFQVLCHLAQVLEVSLDYLVYGHEAVPRNMLEAASPMLRSLDQRLEVLTDAAHRRADLLARLVGRVKESLGTVIETKISDALAAVNELHLPAGFLTDDEVMVLESCAMQVDIISMNLAYDIIETSEGIAAGRFAEVVAENLLRDVRYRFLLPVSIEADRAKRVATGYRDLLNQLGCTRQLVTTHCQFRHSSHRVMSGTGLCRVDRRRLRDREPALEERLSQSLSKENWIGYTIAPSHVSHGDSVMDIDHLQNARSHFDQLWATADRIR